MRSFSLHSTITVVVVTALAALVQAGESLSPEDTVKRYLAAMKDGRHADAYGYVSTGMAGGKAKEVWAKEMQAIMQVTEAKIFGFTVYPGKVEGDTARVPNILSSQDKFLNQLGAEEYELYTLKKEGGAWKIDQQQIVEPTEISRWFPDRTP